MLSLCCLWRPGRHLVIAGKPVDEQLGGREGRGVQGGQSRHRRRRVSELRVGSSQRWCGVHRSRHHPVVHQPAPGEQPRPKTSDGLRVDVDGELLERGRRHRRLEHHHGVVLQHLPGVRDSGGVCAGGGGGGDRVPRGIGGIGRGCQFVSPQPAGQFPSGDPDTPCWDGFKRLLIFIFQPTFGVWPQSRSFPCVFFFLVGPAQEVQKTFF